jgi:hypothetical protein
MVYRGDAKLDARQNSWIHTFLLCLK